MRKEEIMKLKKRLAAALLGLALALPLAGCENLPLAGGFVDYDVSGYIQALLDSSYHNNHNSFVAITRASEENAQANNSSTVENAAINFCNTYGISPTEAQLAQLKDIMGQAMAQAKYTVKEEQKTENGYYIEVEVTPITNFAGLSSQLDVLRTQAQQEAMPSPTPVPAESGEESGENGEGYGYGDEGWEAPSPTPSPTPEPAAPEADPKVLYVDKVLEFCRGQLGNLTYQSQNITIALEIRQTPEGELQLDMNQIETIDNTVLRLTGTGE